MNREQTVVIHKKFFHHPVRTGAWKKLIRLSREGSTVLEFDAELDPGNPTFVAAIHVEEFMGERPENELRYREHLPPQFHFSPMGGG